MFSLLIFYLSMLIQQIFKLIQYFNSNKSNTQNQQIYFLTLLPQIKKNLFDSSGKTNMGTMCVQQKRMMYQHQIRYNPDAKRKYEQQRNRQYQNHPYAQVITKYTYFHYGRKPDQQTKDFIQNNYNPDYRSTNDYNYTYKYNLFDRMQTAYKNNGRTSDVRFIYLDQSKNMLKYRWLLRASNQNFNYQVTAYFDQQGRLKEQSFYREIQYKSTPRIETSIPSTSRPYQQSSSNNYYGPPPPGIDYAAQVQRSNEQFRNNMNKQAQQWNDYARQKNNRGY